MINRVLVTFHNNIELLNSKQCLDNSSANKILTIPGQRLVKAASYNINDDNNYYSKGSKGI